MLVTSIQFRVLDGECNLSQRRIYRKIAQLCLEFKCLANPIATITIYYIEDGVAMAIRPRILLVGDEITLLQSREMVLSTRFDVKISPRLSEALSLVLKETFDLIVVFPKIESWREFAEFIARQTSKPTLIAVTRKGGDSPNWADAAVALGSGPFELLKVCAQRFGITMRTKSHGFSNRSFKKVVPMSSGRD